MQCLVRRLVAKMMCNGKTDGKTPLLRRMDKRDPWKSIDWGRKQEEHREDPVLYAVIVTKEA